MMRSRRGIKIMVVILFVLIILSWMPVIYRTCLWASDATGLSVLATLSDDEFTVNPYDMNGILVTPDFAVWILKNYDWPYERCSGMPYKMDLCGRSLVSWVGASLDRGSSSATDRGYEILGHFISRGEPINTKSDGLTPIHQAILYNNPRYLSLLLQAGADPFIPVDQPNKAVDGFNAFQFLGFLDSKGHSDFSGIRSVLRQFELNE